MNRYRRTLTVLLAAGVLASHTMPAAAAACSDTELYQGGEWVALRSVSRVLNTNSETPPAPAQTTEPKGTDVPKTDTKTEQPNADNSKLNTQTEQPNADKSKLDTKTEQPN